MNETGIPLFEGIAQQDLQTMLSCLLTYRKDYSRGEVIIMEQDSIGYTGVILSGTVHMIKEDIWGHQTLLAYMHENDLIAKKTRQLCCMRNIRF